MASGSTAAHVPASAAVVVIGGEVRFAAVRCVGVAIGETRVAGAYHALPRRADRRGRVSQTVATAAARATVCSGSQARFAAVRRAAVAIGEPRVAGAYHAYARRAGRRGGVGQTVAIVSTGSAVC